jgi:hypothetical protein
MNELDRLAEAILNKSKEKPNMSFDEQLNFMIEEMCN